MSAALSLLEIFAGDNPRLLANVASNTEVSGY
jgi:hypothetical protein